LWNELELKVFLPKKGDGFIVTSQAKAGEVLDVYAVEFSKTTPRSGYPRKRPPLMEAPERSDTRTYQASVEGLSNFLEGGPVSCAAVSGGRRMIAAIV
jgi:hypothetical protein